MSTITGTKKVITGNHAVSYGALLSRVQVISAYPITPQTQIVEQLSEFVADGVLRARFINVESEHSAMSACIGASAAGARTFTATSSQGLALMHEMLHWAAGSRLPIVLANVNRAMAPPWNIWTDQTDSLSQRDTGWLQVYCESNQEVLDSVIFSFKISEQILLPSMLVLDAFVLSHTYEPVEIYPQERVDEFLPPYNPKFALRPGEEGTMGGLSAPDTYYEFRYKIQQAMEKAVELIPTEGEVFGEILGRRYGLVEEFLLEDADTVVVTSGALTSTAKFAVHHLRQEKRKKVGILKMRYFRPFPFETVRKLLKGRKRIAVLDRNLSLGHSGIWYSEIKSALYPLKDRPPVYGYVLGLGGRDVTPKDILEIISDVEHRDELDMPEILWKGVKR